MGHAKINTKLLHKLPEFLEKHNFPQLAHIGS